MEVYFVSYYVDWLMQAGLLALYIPEDRRDDEATAVTVRFFGAAAFSVAPCACFYCSLEHVGFAT